MELKRKINYQLADMVDGRGRLERPLADDDFLPPHGVSIEDGCLLFDYGQRRGYGVSTSLDQLVSHLEDAASQIEQRQAKYGPGLLDQFLRLADAPDWALLDYARRWGALGLCDHGVPAGHDASCQRAEAEPLARWRFYSRYASALLAIAASLHVGQVGADGDWLHVLRGLLAGKPAETAGGRWWRRTVPSEWGALSDRVNAWLDLGHVRLRLRYSRGLSAVRLAGAGLFGALGAQLLQAISRGKGLAMCSNCGAPYAPKRRLARGRRHYCDNPACSKQARWRDSKRAKNSIGEA